ncbi:MAG: hypothetical protein ACMXYK_03410 [Candidatus Woesearchaeota archaeon]
MKLHHSAYTIKKGYADLLEDFCVFLGAKKIWEGFDQGKEIAMQFEEGFTLQFSEITAFTAVTKNKQETHIAFSSTNPQTDLETIQKWFSDQNIITKTGSWSESELWIDCPEVFSNFVIEILDVR